MSDYTYCPYDLIYFFIERIQIVFHVLIPISVWNWNEHSKLAIRFANTKSSEWNEIFPKCSQHPWYVCIYTHT